MNGFRNVLIGMLKTLWVGAANMRPMACPVGKFKKNSSNGAASKRETNINDTHVRRGAGGDPFPLSL